MAHPLQLRLLDLHRNGGHDGLGRLFLERGQFLPVTLVVFAPELPLRGVVDEASRHAQSVAGAPDAALDRVAGAELAQPGLGIGIATECEGRVPGQDTEPPEARQIGDDVLSQGRWQADQRLVLGEVPEGQNGHEGLARPRTRRCGPEPRRH